MQTCKRLHAFTHQSHHHPPPPPPTTMDMNDLPEDLIATILSFTGPRESCRLAVISATFWSASLSDTVWDRFLPADYLSILSGDDENKNESKNTPSYGSKKDHFLRLCHNPTLIDGGTKSFSLDKRSGKKCYMISCRDLYITWGDTPRYWKWIPDSDSRFGEAAELVGVCWLEIKGRIRTSLLSPTTLYTAYLVFKPTQGSYGFDYQPVEVSVGISGSEESKSVRTAFLDGGGAEQMRRRVQVVTAPRRLGSLRFSRGRVLGFLPHAPVQGMTTEDGTGGDGARVRGIYPKERGDEWFEVELGDFLSKEGEVSGEVLEMCVAEVKGGNWKGGLVVQGIEIRPKQG